MKIILYFTNSDNTKLYCFEIEDNRNKLTLIKNKESKQKGLLIADYFNVCNLETRNISKKELWINTKNH